MNPYARLDDVIDGFPRALTSAEEERAEWLLTRASFQLGVWVPGLTTTEDATVLEAAKYIVVDMVTRALLAAATAATMDPAVESVTEGAGPYNRAIRYRSSDGNLFLYTRELEDLEGLLRGNRASAVSMRSPGL